MGGIFKRTLGLAALLVTLLAAPVPVGSTLKAYRSGDDVILEWEKVGEPTYNIWRDTRKDFTSAVRIDSIPSSLPARYEDTNAVTTGDPLYFYRVRSENQCGEE